MELPSFMWSLGKDFEYLVRRSRHRRKPWSNDFDGEMEHCQVYHLQQELEKKKCTLRRIRSLVPVEVPTSRYSVSHM